MGEYFVPRISTIDSERTVYLMIRLPRDEARATSLFNLVVRVMLYLQFQVLNDGEIGGCPLFQDHHALVLS